MTAFRQQVQAFIDANLTPAARSRILADVARQGLADLQRTGQAPATFDRFVDGREGADESTVRGDGYGQITYTFSYVSQAAVFALAFLTARAPARSGKFRKSFYFGINGRFVPAASFNADSVPNGAEVTIGNTAPYSRKIDVQIAGGKRLSFSVPAGIFDDCAAAVNRQFRGAIKAKRVYSLNFPGQYSLRRGKTRGSLVQSPAIVISSAV